MTIITGHNQIIQHAGKAQEFAQQNQNPRPSAEAAIPVQQEREILQRSSVQSSEKSAALKKERKRRDSSKNKDRKDENTSRKPDPDRELDPDAPGRLLDTII